MRGGEGGAGGSMQVVECQIERLSVTGCSQGTTSPAPYVVRHFAAAALDAPPKAFCWNAYPTSDPSDAALAESSALAADPTRCPAQTLLSCARTSCQDLGRGCRTGKKHKAGGDFDSHGRGGTLTHTRGRGG